MKIKSGVLQMLHLDQTYSMLAGKNVKILYEYFKLLDVHEENSLNGNHNIFFGFYNIVPRCSLPSSHFLHVVFNRHCTVAHRKTNLGCRLLRRPSTTAIVIVQITYSLSLDVTGSFMHL